MASIYVVNSRNHGTQEFEIRSSTGYGYVFLNGQKIAEGGKMATPRESILAYDHELEAIAKRWWKRHLEIQRGVK